MKVAVVNMQDSDFEARLLKSVTKTGFVVLTHHGIDFGLIKEAQTQWREFFLQDALIKNMFVNQQDGNLGYKRLGTETAVGSNIPDLKEFYHWKPGKTVPGNVKNVTSEMYEQLDDVAQEVLTVLSRHNQSNYHDQCYESDNTLFRSLYYPALKDVQVAKDAVRAAAHEDINHITMLVAASASGLQVKDVDGNWHDVPHEENSITVNIGDMLQLASKGLYKSTTHRVVNPDNSTSDRLSMPLFVHPHSDTVLAPGVTAGSFLAERIAQIYGKK